jgi:hypothetical protein
VTPDPRPLSAEDVDDDRLTMALRIDSANALGYREGYREGYRAAEARHAALGVLLRQFVDYGNQQYVPDEDMESLMAEAETFLDHGLDALERETS